MSNVIQSAILVVLLATVCAQESLSFTQEIDVIPSRGDISAKIAFTATQRRRVKLSLRSASEWLLGTDTTVNAGNNTVTLSISLGAMRLKPGTPHVLVASLLPTTGTWRDHVARQRMDVVVDGLVEESEGKGPTESPDCTAIIGYSDNPPCRRQCYRRQRLLLQFADGIGEENFAIYVTPNGGARREIPGVGSGSVRVVDLEIQADMEFFVDLVPGYPVPSLITVRQTDRGDSCRGTSSLVLPNRPAHGFRSSTRKPGPYEMVCPGQPQQYGQDDALFYDRCRGDVFERVLLLPEGEMPGEQQIVITFLDQSPPMRGECSNRDTLRCLMVPKRSEWKFASFDDIAPSFEDSDFDDSSWPSGSGLLGFGGVVQTPLSPSTTYYFRRKMNIPESKCYLGLKGFTDILAKDGYAIFINGVEVQRRNLPFGIMRPPLATDFKYTSDLMLSRPLTMVVDGLNVIAIEVRTAEEQDTKYPDLYFDAGYRFEVYSDCV